MVRNAAQAQRQLALAAALAAAVLAGGCGGGSKASRAPAAAARPGTIAVPPEPPAGSGANPTLGEARLADCVAWRHGDVGERYGTIREIRGFAGGASGGTPGVRGATMPDRTAYKVFASWCSHGYAAYFKLYKLYTRAAAFMPQRQ